ncbi:MAG: hypothetical protein Q8Q89_03045 [bacterium]|nr:hypothetical protein [bacterium]
MEKSPQNNREHIEVERQYSDLINSYHERTQELRKELSKPSIANDTEAQQLVQFIDKERHDLHLKIYL